MAYQRLVEGKQVCLLVGLRVRAETNSQAAAIHAYRLLESYGQSVRTQSEAEAFLLWLLGERCLCDCTIAGLITHYRLCSGGNRELCIYKLKWQQQYWWRCRRGER